MHEPQGLTAPTAKADEDEFVEFFRAGDPVAGEFECVACSYDAVHRGVLPRCPACGSALWERTAWTPFARALSGLGQRIH
jgi:hypothetical protein